MSAAHAGRGLPAVALLESAFHLLRRTPAPLWLAFYAGTAPWTIALLVYAAEMVGPGRWSVEGAALLAAGYIGMKAGQGVFARGLLRLAGGGRPTAGAPAGAARSTARQAALQAWSLLALPAAFVVTLPFGWVYAFFQSLAVTGDPAAARRQAARWPRQNHVLLLLLGLVAAVVFLNAAIAILLAPLLLERLLGIENVAARNPFGMLSWTTAALAAAVTYLGVAPLAKAAYALRCFHGEVERGGEDLRAELALRRLGAGAALALILGAVAGLPLAASAQSAAAVAPETPHESPRTIAPAPALDAALDEVLARPEFSWRLPRARGDSPERGFFTPLLETLSRWVRATANAIDRMTEWLRRLFRPPAPQSADSGAWGWIGSTYLWLRLLVVALVAAGILLARRRRGTVAEPAATAAPIIMDPLADVAAAAATPADEWLLRADELLRAGNARHAVRALYLATLSLLAQRKLLLPERSKSNRDYLVEVRRRGRDRPELAETFGAASAAFESIWYGDHAATGDSVRSLRAQHESMRAHAG